MVHVCCSIKYHNNSEIFFKGETRLNDETCFNSKTQIFFPVVEFVANEVYVLSRGFIACTTSLSCDSAIMHNFNDLKIIILISRRVYNL